MDNHLREFSPPILQIQQENNRSQGRVRGRGINNLLPCAAWALEPTGLTAAPTQVAHVTPAILRLSTAHQRDPSFYRGQSTASANPRYHAQRGLPPEPQRKAQCACPRYPAEQDCFGAPVPNISAQRDARPKGANRPRSVQVMSAKVFRHETAQEGDMKSPTKLIPSGTGKVVRWQR